MQHVPTDEEIEDVAVLVAYDLELEAADARRPSMLGKRSLWEAHLRFIESEVREQAMATATGDDANVSRFIDEIVEALQWNLPPGSARRAKLVRALNKSLLAAHKVNGARASGNVDATSDSDVVRRVVENRSKPTRQSSTIMKQFELYAAEHAAAKTKRPAGINQDRMVVKQFADFVGAERDIASITFDDAKAYVDALAEVPDSYKKKAAYRGLTIHQAIEKGRREGTKTLSLVTQARYVSQLSPFFDWVEGDHGGRLIAVNPFDGLHKNTARLRGERRRPPIDAAQLQQFVRSPLFMGYLKDGKEHVPGTQRTNDWRFWLPLLCIFTGARIGEVAQLRVDDVFKQFGVWCVEFRHDSGTGQMIKNNTSRVVALHSTLLKIGFAEFVGREVVRAKRDGEQSLFPDLTAEEGQSGAIPSRWLRDYMKAIGIKEGRDGVGPHSFRHTMADQLRAAGHLDHVFGPLVLGHGQGGSVRTTAGYGSASEGTVQQLQAMIESVNFVPIVRGRVVEGGKPVDFSHLYYST